MESGAINKSVDSVIVIRHHDYVKANTISFVAHEAALDVHCSCAIEGLALIPN